MTGFIEHDRVVTLVPRRAAVHPSFSPRSQPMTDPTTEEDVNPYILKCQREAWDAGRTAVRARITELEAERDELEAVLARLHGEATEGVSG